MGLLSVSVMVKSAEHCPTPASTTGTECGSGVWARAAVIRSSENKKSRIGPDYKTFKAKGRILAHRSGLIDSQGSFSLRRFFAWGVKNDPLSGWQLRKSDGSAHRSRKFLSKNVT